MKPSWRSWAARVGRIATPALAVASLAFSGYSVYLSHQTLLHNRMLVVPIMNQAVFERSGPNSVGFKFKNNGLGPAIIHETTVRFAGERFDHRNSDEWRRAIREVFGEGVTWQVTYLDGGNAIRPGDELVILSLSESTQNRRSIAALREGLRKFDIQITYSSVYGERKSVK